MQCKKFVSVALAGAMSMSMCAPAYAATDSSGAVRDILGYVRRTCRIYKHDEIIGKDRYETGSMVAEKVGRYSRVILVNGSTAMADGLSAASLAGRLGATILPIKANAIPESSRKVIDKAEEVYIIGGTNAISRKVEESIKAPTVVRIGGRDRCETSLKVAEKLGPYNKAYLVNGYTGEADAMSISPISARDGAPVIITNGKTSKLPKKSATKYVVIGGRAVMTQKLLQKYDGHRIGGANRYDTNRMVINTYSKSHNTRYFCNGETLVDALSASYMAKGDGIVLVNRKENHDLLKWVDTVQIGGPKFDIYFPDLHRRTKPEKPSGITTEVTNITNSKGDYYVKFIYSGGDNWEWEGRTEDDMYSPGHHKVKVRNVNDNGDKSDWVTIEFDVEGRGPVAEPVINAVVRRNPNPDRKFPVDLTVSGVNGYDCEWDGVTKDGYYSPGKHVVKLRLIDKEGNKSEWYNKEFEVTDNSPTVPVVEVVKSRDSNGVKAEFKIKTPSIDADGDKIEYQWQGVSNTGYYTPGKHVVHVRATDETGNSSKWVNVEFMIEDSTETIFPEVKVEVDRNPNPDRKFKVNFIVDNTGYKVEVAGGSPDGLYAKGEYTVKVKVTDSNGNESEWTDKTFEIRDERPTNPEFEPKQTKDDKGVKVDFIEIKASIDPDGDAVEYEWAGDYKEDGYYAPGKHVVTVQAVDSTGLKSDVVEIPFEVSDGKIPSDKLPAIKVDVAKDPNPDGKHKVDITTEDGYGLEVKGGNEDGLYLPGNYDVEVQLTDKDGNKSDWIPVTIIVPGEFKPVINVEVGDTPDENGKYKVDITSPDGKVEVKDGPTDGKYLPGHYEVEVIVTDKDGKEVNSKVEFDVPKGGDNPSPEPGKTPEVKVEIAKDPNPDGKHKVDFTSPDGTVTVKKGNEDGLYPPGHHEVEVTVTDKDGKATDVTVEFDIPEPAPVVKPVPSIKITIDEAVDSEGKHKVTLEDNNGNAVEVRDGAPDSKYLPGHHKVEVQVTDKDGNKSDWVPIEFDVPEGKPTFNPTVNVTVGKDIDSEGKRKVDITSPEGTVEVRGGSEDSKYLPGHYNVDVQVTNKEGEKSAWIPIDFTIPFVPGAIKYEIANEADPDGKRVVTFTEANGNKVIVKDAPEGNKYTPGKHDVEVQVEDSKGNKSDWIPVSFEIPITADLQVDISENPNPDGKHKVEITDKKGREVEIQGGHSDKLYLPGEYKVKVQVTDKDGLKSNWVDVTFVVPLVPDLDVKISDKPDTDGKREVTITDKNGNTVKVKDVPADNKYAPGEHVIEVQVTNKDGIKSDWVQVKVTIPKLPVIPAIAIAIDKVPREDGKHKVVLTDKNGNTVEVKDGKAEDYYDPGHHKVEVQVTDKDGDKSDWVPVEFDIAKYVPTDVTITVDRNPNPEREFKVELTPVLEGATLEIKDGAADKYYPEGKHKVQIQVTDKDGNKSDWVDVEFTVTDNKPTTPDFDIKKTNGETGTNVVLDITKPSTDADKDAISYVWTKDGEAFTPNPGGDIFASGEHTVTLKAVDATGLESEVVTKTFEVDTPPGEPEVVVTKTREHKGIGPLRKFKVTLDAGSQEVQWQDKADDDFYKPNEEQIVKVRAKGSNGLYSPWKEIKFTVTDNAPTKPEISATRVSEGSFEATIQLVKESTDSDGDAIEYVYKGKEDTGNYGPGEHKVSVKAVDSTGLESEEFILTFNLADNRPSIPQVVTNAADRVAQDGKAKVTVTPSGSTSPLGREVTYEYEGKQPGDLYDLGKEYSVKVRAKDTNGLVSDWVTATFTVNNTAPTKPSFLENILGNWQEDKQKVTIDLTQSTDAEGDAITYEWEEDGKLTSKISEFFAVGTHTIRVRAKDTFGAVSDWFEKTFTINAPKPTDPTVTASEERVAVGGKAKVLVTATGSTAPNGAEVEYVFDEGKASDDLYELNKSYTVKAKAVAGKYESNWVPVTFEVKNTAPTKPEFTVSQVDDKWYDGKQKVTVTASTNSQDAEGDDINYVWGGDKAQNDLYAPGTYTITYKAVDKFGAASEESQQTFTVKAPIPDPPVISVDDKTRNGSNGMAHALVTASGGASPEGKDVEYVWEGKDETDFYPLNTPVTVRVKSVCGKYESEWAEKTFTIENKAPNKPSFTVDTSDKAWYDGKMKATVKLTEATDPDGDEVTHVWEGKDENDLYTPGQEITLKVKAVDGFGVDSGWVEQKFTLEYPGPTVPELTVDTSIRRGSNGKALVPITATGSKAFGGATIVDYEFEGKASDDLYTLNEAHKVKVRAKDSNGKYSEWAEKEFTVSNGAPPNPVFTLTPNNKWVDGKQEVTLSVEDITDPDGDEVTFEFKNFAEGLVDYLSPGVHEVEVRVKDAFGAVSDWVKQVITIGEPKPTKPNVEISEERIGQDRKARVIITPSGSTSPTGSKITYEFDSAKAADDLYTLNDPHIVKVRAKNEEGMVSDWAEASFTVINSGPSVPDFTVDQSDKAWVGGKQKVTLKVTQEGIDPDGDPVHYEWDKAEDDMYAPGSYVVKCRSVDSFGVYSHWVEKSFTIKAEDAILINGPDFSTRVNSLATGGTINKVQFTKGSSVNMAALKQGKTEGKDYVNLAEGSNPGAIIGYMTGTTLNVATDMETLYMNPNSSYMFTGRGGDLYNPVYLPMRSVQSINLEALDSSKVTDLSYFIFVDTNVGRLNVSNWDVSKITTLRYAFASNINSTLDLSNWKTTSLESLHGTFGDKIKGLNIANLDTSKVTDMQHCFGGGSASIPRFKYNLSGWDTSSCKNMKYMFHQNNTVSGVLGLGALNTGNVTNMEGMFRNTEFANPNDYHEVEGWDTHSLVTCGDMFNGTNLKTLNLTGWDTSSLRATKASGDLGLYGMFEGCRELTTLDVSNFDVSRCYSLAYFVNQCGVLTNLNLKDWDTSNVTYMQNAFNGCHKLKGSFTVASDYIKTDGAFVETGKNSGGQFIIYYKPGFNSSANYLKDTAIGGARVQVKPFK